MLKLTVLEDEIRMATVGRVAASTHVKLTGSSIRYTNRSISLAPALPPALRLCGTTPFF